MAQRLQAEGAASPADVILTVDIARLAEYAALDLLAPVDSAVLIANIPPHLRSSDNRWFGLSERARILVISNDRVPVYGTINYEYPANSAVAAPAELASWGAFKRDTLPTERLAELAPEAQMIIDRVGW